MLADGDGDGATVGDVLTDAVGDGDVCTDGEAVAVGDVDVCTDEEAVADGDWYVPVYDGAVAGYDTPWEADGLADAPGELCTADGEAAAEDVCAGWS